MTNITENFLQLCKKIASLAWRNKYQTGGLTLVALWCIPYFTTGSRIEWGDFSFFAQAYEAMRLSVVHYHQFPWMNPWIAGGVPLYANPQMGLFSIQTPLVFIFGAPIGLKLAVVLYTFAGYASMQLLLRKYFKISVAVAVPLSLLWVFCSFFVDHLPSHFTFAWYLLAPLYVYLALTVKSLKSGLLFGLAFAVMALSQIHNPFFHISFVCAAILLVRLVREASARITILKALLASAGVFIVLAGHRALYTLQNVHDFPRLVFDPAASIKTSALGPILPYSNAHTLSFINYPTQPNAPYGYGEVTATIGIFSLIAVLICVLYIGHNLYTRRKQALKSFKKPIATLGIGLLFASIGFGAFTRFAPYNFIKHLPVFGQMRVSSRWFLWLDLALLAFVGLMAMKTPRKSFPRTAVMSLLCLGVFELFVLNFGYQSNVLSHPVVTAPKDIKSYSFQQTAHFGETLKLPDGGTIPDDGDLPRFYREYEATTFNLGVLMANDALVDLNTKATPRCGWEKGCSLVMSNNAKVVSWSPQKLVLKRTAPGKIYLNMNASNYFVVNGKRMSNSNVAEAYKKFPVPVSDNVKVITIQASPSPITAVKEIRQHKALQK